MVAKNGYLPLLQRVGNILWLLILAIHISRMIQHFSSLLQYIYFKNQNGGSEMADKIGYLSLLQRVGDISWLLSLTFNILRIIKRFSSILLYINFKNQYGGYKMAASLKYLFNSKKSSNTHTKMRYIYISECIKQSKTI